MEHLMKMRTRFELNQTVVWKGKSGLYKGKVVGLHDDFVFVKEHVVTTVLDVVIKTPIIYRVDFEDVIARV